MTLTEIKARMNYLIAEAERDQAARKSYQELDKDGYKWILSANVFTALELGNDAYSIPFEKIEKICFCGIPVTIDYITRDKMELWRKIGEA